MHNGLRSPHDLPHCWLIKHNRGNIVHLNELTDHVKPFDQKVRLLCFHWRIQCSLGYWNYRTLFSSVFDSKCYAVNTYCSIMSNCLQKMLNRTIFTSCPHTITVQTGDVSTFTQCNSNMRTLWSINNELTMTEIKSVPEQIQKTAEHLRKRKCHLFSCVQCHHDHGKKFSNSKCSSYWSLNCAFVTENSETKMN